MDNKKITIETHNLDSAGRVISIAETWHSKDGSISFSVSPPIIKKASNWLRAENNPTYQDLLKNIGIGFLHPTYIEINEIQDKDDENKKINKFIAKYINQYSEKNRISKENLKIEFINYGKTELVYVLTINDIERVTILVKQPAVQFGKIKQEAENLIELNAHDKNVIAPIDYYQYGDYELYVTPYINQARCIASYGSWGMYIPEPYYRFQPFSDNQEKIVNCCMIAKLISLYDFEKQEGISACKLGGGDFMLPKGWEIEQPTIENTLNNLYLIAAREKINCNFEEYIAIIRDEFSRATILEKQEELIINLRARVPIKKDAIEAGIQLGLKIIEEKNICNDSQSSNGHIKAKERKKHI